MIEKILKAIVIVIRYVCDYCTYSRISGELLIIFVDVNIIRRVSNYFQNTQLLDIYWVIRGLFNILVEFTLSYSS